ncbi:MAG: hypothetical protein OXP07_12015, partial [Defluviicoccus sp.]|nr:hypothetical protein [Defluviicoccus sp.]
MTEQSDLRRDRVEIALDRGTRVVRLLTWTAMFLLVCLMLWVVSGMAANAEEPKAAARALGNAGNAAARAVARESSNAAEVPGYAGTNLPERNIGANALEDEGRARLADPDDPGGKAGGAVIRGTTSRPAASVPATDPAVTRAEGIAASPQSSAFALAWRARSCARRTSAHGSQSVRSGDAWALPHFVQMPAARRSACCWRLRSRSYSRVRSGSRRGLPSARSRAVRARSAARRFSRHGSQSVRSGAGSALPHLRQRPAARRSAERWWKRSRLRRRFLAMSQQAMTASSLPIRKWTGGRPASTEPAGRPGRGASALLLAVAEKAGRDRTPQLPAAAGLEAGADDDLGGGG